MKTSKEKYTERKNSQTNYVVEFNDGKQLIFNTLEQTGKALSLTKTRVRNISMLERAVKLSKGPYRHSSIKITKIITNFKSGYQLKQESIEETLIEGLSTDFMRPCILFSNIWISRDGELAIKYNEETEKWTTPSMNATKFEYRRISSYDETGKWCTKYVHRLVGTAFLDPVEGKNDINHINGDKGDNRAENLEWCTHSENMTHAFNTLGFKLNKSKFTQPVKDNNGNIYLSVQEAINKLNLCRHSVYTLLKHPGMEMKGISLERTNEVEGITKRQTSWSNIRVYKRIGHGKHSQFGELVGTFNTLKEAAEFINPNNITSARGVLSAILCNRQLNNVKGFKVKADRNDKA